MSRRQFVLQEIGHTPLWQSRQAPTTLGPAAAAVASHAAVEPPQPAPTVAQATGTPAHTTVTEQVAASTAANMVLTPASLSAPAPSEAPDIRNWSDLQLQVAGCQRCELARTRRQVVVGRGNTSAKVMIIGEAPGEQEDRQGLPFVGKAGQLLENMLSAAGLDSREDVYICNVIKCRPPGNRNPAAAEIASCHDYLRWQIEAVAPQLIVALGRFAAHTLLHSEAPISTLRRQTHQAYDRPLLVTFHPAYLLRSPAEKAKAWQDWHQVRSLLQSTLARP